LKNILLSLRHLVEGGDGNLSIKRVMAAIVFPFFLCTQDMERLMYLGGFILLLLGVTTAQTYLTDKLRKENGSEPKGSG
jgi:hypothetical protein